jgi:hypothetical protein
MNAVCIATELCQLLAFKTGDVQEAIDLLSSLEKQPLGTQR